MRHIKLYEFARDIPASHTCRLKGVLDIVRFLSILDKTGLLVMDELHVSDENSRLSYSLVDSTGWRQPHFWLSFLDNNLGENSYSRGFDIKGLTRVMGAHKRTIECNLYITVSVRKFFCTYYINLISNDYLFFDTIADSGIKLDYLASAHLLEQSMNSIVADGRYQAASNKDYYADEPYLIREDYFRLSPSYDSHYKEIWNNLNGFWTLD